MLGDTAPPQLYMPRAHVGRAPGPPAHPHPRPPAAQTVRGFHCALIIVDEAAYISPELFYEGIMPVLMQGTTALNCISTTGGRDNFYSKLLTARDEHTGLPVFHAIRMGGEACDACSTDPIKAVLCSHASAQAPPPWISHARRDRLQALYTGDLAHIYRREFMGMIADEGNEFLRSEFITALEDARRVPTPRAPLFYVAIDPSGGGRSKMAAVALVQDGPRAVLVGIGSVHIGDQIDRETSFLTTFIGLVRQRPALARAHCVVICEGAPGNAAAAIANGLRAVPDHTFMHEVAGDRVGVPINERLMHKMAYTLQGALAVGGLAVCDELLVVRSAMGGDAGAGAATATAGGDGGLFGALCTQMRNLGWKLVQKRRLDGDDKYRLTAKTSSDSADLIMALMHGLYWQRVFVISPRADYGALRRLTWRR